VHRRRDLSPLKLARLSGDLGPFFPASFHKPQHGLAKASLPCATKQGESMHMAALEQRACATLPFLDVASAPGLIFGTICPLDIVDDRPDHVESFILRNQANSIQTTQCPKNYPKGRQCQLRRLLPRLDSTKPMLSLRVSMQTQAMNRRVRPRSRRVSESSLHTYPDKRSERTHEDVCSDGCSVFHACQHGGQRGKEEGVRTEVRCRGLRPWVRHFRPTGRHRLGLRRDNQRHLKLADVWVHIRHQQLRDRRRRRNRQGLHRGQP